MTRKFSNNLEFKLWKKRHKTACIHFCRCCWYKFTHDIDKSKCKIKAGAYCEDYNGAFCEKKVITDAELMEVF